MKLRIIMEVEIFDLPDDERSELADGLNFAAEGENPLYEENEEYLPPVPRIQDCDDEEIISNITGMLEDALPNLDAQRELWAGSHFYGYVGKIEVASCDKIS